MSFEYFSLQMWGKEEKQKFHYGEFILLFIYCYKKVKKCDRTFKIKFKIKLLKTYFVYKGKWEKLNEIWKKKKKTEESYA